MPNAQAQELRSGVIQQVGSDNIKVEFETYTYLFPPAPSDPTLRTWVEESNANASNGMGIRADGGSANGGDPLKMSKVKFDIYFATSGNYYMYLRVLAPDGNSNALCIPTGFNKPICSVQTISPPSSSFQWLAIPTPFNVPAASIGDVLTLTFFPHEVDVLVDQMVLHTDPALVPIELEALSLTGQQLPLPPQGVIGLSTFEDLPWELQVNTGASSNINTVGFPGVDEDYFPYVGLQVLQMDQQSNDLITGNSNVTFDPFAIDCYAGSDLELCFRWIAPAAIDGLFGLGDIFTVNVAYFDGITPLSTENLLLVNGTDINTQGQCYQQTCTILTVPLLADFFVLSFDLISDDPLADIWLDQVSLETSSTDAPLALMTDCMLAGPDLEVNGFNSLNEVSYIWVVSDGTVVGPSPTATTFNHTFTANGTYLVCLIVVDACGNLHIDCKEVTITGFLPIELMSFDAKKEKENVLLNWSTQTETNNSHFMVEHSTDGIRFRALGRIEGAGDATNIQHYQYQHNDPGSGIHYYRLLQVDFDGQSEYSDIISLEFDAKPDIQVFPNPFRDWVRVEYDLSNPVQFKVFDVNGRLLFSENVREAQALDLGFLKTGVYFAKVQSENGKVIKQERIIKAN